MNYSHPPIQEILPPADFQFAIALHEFDLLRPRPPAARESLGRRHFAECLRGRAFFLSISECFIFFCLFCRHCCFVVTAALTTCTGPTHHVMSAQCVTNACSSRPSRLLADGTPYQLQNFACGSATCRRDTLYPVRPRLPCPLLPSHTPSADPVLPTKRCVARLAARRSPSFLRASSLVALCCAVTFSTIRPLPDLSRSDSSLMTEPSSLGNLLQVTIATGEAVSFLREPAATLCHPLLQRPHLPSLATLCSCPSNMTGYN